MRKRKIAVVTTSRADAGHLHWILMDLAKHRKVDLRLIALGAHLSPEFGRTGDSLASSGVQPSAAIECLLSSDTDVGMAKTIGLATLGLADYLGSSRPDLILLIADRYEMLAPASVALALRIPIAHIEGGDVSEGAIDNAVRNALTQMSHLHFACSRNSRERIIRMGEEPWRVHFTGSPALDQLRRRRLLSQVQVERELNLSLKPQTLVVAYHPVTLLRDTTREANALFSALSQVNSQLLFVYPNADAGSRSLIELSRTFIADRGNAHLFVNLDHITYLSLLNQSSALIGNSSSGIMESTSLGLPVVNIGIRQNGRDHAANVIDVPASVGAILDAIRVATSKQFRQAIRKLENPYGDGHAAEKIVKLLVDTPFGKKLLFKRTRRMDAEGISLARI
jgi:UDP-hydrolysing UDP-N-acetyl-D-glucosamine 2-epimerase